MSENGNGDTPPSEWQVHEKAIQRVDDPAVRESLFFGLERDREAHRMRAQQGREMEKRFAMIFGDNAMLLKGIGRIESKMDFVLVTQEIHGAKIGALDRHVNQVDGDVKTERVSREELQKQHDELEQRHARAERTMAQNTSRYAVERVRLEERVNWLDKRQDKIEGAVVETGKDAAVSKELADRAFDSTHDIIDERHEERVEKREVAKEVREDRRYLWRWALGLVALVVASVLAGHYGIPPQHSAAPSAAH